jgi:hypothetical protein
MQIHRGRAMVGAERVNEASAVAISGSKSHTQSRGTKAQFHRGRRGRGGQGHLQKMCQRNAIQGKFVAGVVQLSGRQKVSISLPPE